MKENDPLKSLRSLLRRLQKDAEYHRNYRVRRHGPDTWMATSADLDETERGMRDFGDGMASVLAELKRWERAQKKSATA